MEFDQNGISVIPLHKGNIEYIRIQYNEVQDLFTINVNPESDFVINLKAAIYKYRLVEFESMSFLDVFCMDRWKIEKSVNKFVLNDDKEGLLLYLRNLYGNEIIDSLNLSDNQE